MSDRVPSTIDNIRDILAENLEKGLRFPEGVSLFNVDNDSHPLYGVEVAVANIGGDIDELDPLLDREWLGQLRQQLINADFVVCFHARTVEFITNMVRKECVVFHCLPISQPNIEWVGEKSIALPILSKRVDTYYFDAERSDAIEFSRGFSGLDWQGQEIDLCFTRAPYGFHEGLHMMGVNGALSVRPDCKIWMPYKVVGLVQIFIDVKTVAREGNKEFVFKMGQHERLITISPKIETCFISFDLDEPIDLLEMQFCSADKSSWDGLNAIALHNIRLISKEKYGMPGEAIQWRERENSGETIYCARLTDEIGEDNWADLISAYGDALRNEPDCLLILLVSDVSEFMGYLPSHLRSIGEIKNRILVVEHRCGTVPPNLLSACDFYLTASASPNIFPDIVSSMGIGVPIIAPTKNGFEALVGESVGIPIHVFRRFEPVWNERKDHYSPFLYTPDWTSMRDAISMARKIHQTEPENYLTMSENARSKVQGLKLARLELSCGAWPLVEADS